MEPSTKNCIGKAMEIPIIHSASLNVGKAYNNLKTKNTISYLGLEIVEGSFILAWKGLNPLMGRLQKPIDLADAVACFVLEEMKVKYPGIMEPSDKLIESGTKVVFHSSLAKKALVGLEKALGYAEAIVTLVPSISVSDEAEDQTTLLSKTMKPVKLCYVTATWPLRCTANFLHSRRSDISEFTRTYLHSNDNQRVMRRKTLADRIFDIPRFLLCFIGKSTCELCEKRMGISNLRHQFSVEQPSHSGPDIQHPSDDTALEEGDEAAAIADLEKTLNTSATDSTFHPCSGDEMSESFEYHSGTGGDNSDSSVVLEAIGEIAIPSIDAPQAVGGNANPADVLRAIGLHVSHNNHVPPQHYFVNPEIVIDQADDPYLANMMVMDPANIVPIPLHEINFINGIYNYEGEGDIEGDVAFNGIDVDSETQSSTPEVE